MRAVDGHGASTRDATPRLLAPFARDVLLATGRPVRVRPAQADDVAALRRFYGELSEASTYFRFFGVRTSIPEAELLRATEQDASDHVTLVVDANGELIAVGEYYAQPGGEDAEVAFAVADAHHQEGIATVLVEDLAAIAKEAGFRRLVAQTLPGQRWYAARVPGRRLGASQLVRGWGRQRPSRLDRRRSLAGPCRLARLGERGSLAAADAPSPSRRRRRRRRGRSVARSAHRRQPHRLVRRQGERRRSALRRDRRRSSWMGFPISPSSRHRRWR